MDPSFLDPSLPIAEFMRRCRARLDDIETTMRALHEEREGLIRMLSAYTNLQGAEPLRVSGARERPAIPDSSVQRHFFRDILPSVSMIDRSRNDQILDHVDLILRSGKRRKTLELVRMLEQAGVEWTSSNPASLLSTLLSRDHRFVASRIQGWGLKGRSPDEPDDMDEE